MKIPAAKVTNWFKNARARRNRAIAERKKIKGRKILQKLRKTQEKTIKAENHEVLAVTEFCRPWEKIETNDLLALPFPSINDSIFRPETPRPQIPVENTLQNLPVRQSEDPDLQLRFFPMHSRARKSSVHPSSE